MRRSFLTWLNVLVLNADFPSRACRVTPSSRSPNERSRYSASAFSVLTNRFSIRTPICTRSTGRDLFASFIWDIVTNIPMSRNSFLCSISMSAGRYPARRFFCPMKNHFFSTSFVFPRLTSPLAGKIVALLILAGLGPWTARSSAADLIFAAFPLSVGAGEIPDTFGGTLVTPRAFHSATSLPDGRVLLVGGQAAGGATVSCEIYDPATNVWTGAHCRRLCSARWPENVHCPRGNFATLRPRYGPPPRRSQRRELTSLRTS